MRPISLLCLALIFAGCATRASTQTDQTSATRFLESCLASAAREDRDLSNCIGVISSVCFAEPGSETTAGSRECFARERWVWQALADRSAGRLRTASSPDERTALEAYIVAHNDWRSARCGYTSTIYAGGSLAQVAAAECMRDATASLAIDFYQRLNTDYY